MTAESHTLNDGQELAGVSGYLKEAHQGNGSERERSKYPPVLDACCGLRSFWFNKCDPRALFLDNRREKVVLRWGEGSEYTREIKPDIVADFTNLPFSDDTFYLVVFDPPHIVRKSGNLANMHKQFGRLFGDWEGTISKGFRECFRVLRPGGTLIFKWCEYDIPLLTVLELAPEKPLFGHKSGRLGKTHWIAFLKHTGAVAPAPLSESQKIFDFTPAVADALPTLAERERGCRSATVQESN